MVSKQKIQATRESKKKTKTRRVSVYRTNEEAQPDRRKTDSALEWLRYFRNGSADARARLLKRYLPLVRNVAGRMAIGFPRSVELSDLINTGVIGLVEAFRNYDPDRGVKFETYAVPRIRGAILDELRAPTTLNLLRALKKQTGTDVEESFGKITAAVEQAIRDLKVFESDLQHEIMEAHDEIEVEGVSNLPPAMARFLAERAQIPGFSYEVVQDDVRGWIICWKEYTHRGTVRGYGQFYERPYAWLEE